jgi:hypothetical protein
MKKLGIVIAICAAFMLLFSPAASADEVYCGDLTVNWIVVSDSDCSTDVPNAPCQLEIVFLTAAGQTYTIPAWACGTLINVALLKAWNESLTIDACLIVILYPLDVQIVQLGFGTPGLPLP